MPTKNYSLKEKTINTVAQLANATIRTQGSIIDIAVAELAQKAIDADGAINLPAPQPHTSGLHDTLPEAGTPTFQRIIRPRTSKRIRARKSSKQTLSETDIIKPG